MSRNCEMRQHVVMSDAEKFMLDDLAWRTGKSRCKLMREGLRLVAEKYGAPRRRPPKDPRPNE